MSSDLEIKDVQQTACCVVGGGPAGVMLALLLARQKVPVVLLEAHLDFDRDFRGDTVHPSTLEILDQIGLAEPLLALPHGKIEVLRLNTPSGSLVFGDLRHLRTKYPFVMLVPQARFLEFLAEQARQYPNFHLVMGANVQRLVESDGQVRGVQYRASDDQWREVRATLTVGADGRFSKLRSLAGLQLIKTSPPMDVIWFRLPRRAGDPSAVGTLNVRSGHLVVLLERVDEWQVGYVILKGTYAQLKAEGVQVVHRTLSEVAPWLGDRVQHLQDWHQCAVLSVESGRLPRWHKPGLLLIGDAAHVMSPVGGVGINYAIQDAVETANLLGPKLKNGAVTEADLAQVQKVREWPTRVIQRIQAYLQENIAAQTLRATGSFQVPLLLRILLAVPGLRALPARMIAWGARRVRIQS
jgi:2-polyprenyl-6-methoxyphenol hydroxylase-like FAD-dependent oxidoreductase